MAPATLKKSVLLPSAFLLCVSLFLSVQLAWNLEENHLKSATTQHKTSIWSGFQTKLNDDVNLMRANMSFLLQDRLLIDALRIEDREALLNLSAATFQRLRDDHKITHLYFHNKSRVNILRTHQPNRFGDIINRFTAINSAKSGAEFSGLELGPLGTFTLRLVAPVYEKDQIIGFLEIGKEIDNILQGLHEQMGVELFMTINKDLVDIATWQQGMEMLGRSADWNLLPNSLLISQTLPEPPLNVLQRSSGQIASENDWNENITLSDREFSASMISLNDVSDRHVGSIAILRDITGLVGEAENELFQTAVLVMVIGTMVFGFVYVVLERTDNKLDTARSKLQESLNGTIATIDKIIEVRDPYTAGHQTNVARMAVAIGQEMRLSEDCIRGIHLGAMMHDIGKIQVPAEILNKPGKLDEIEFALIKRHPETSYHILKDIDFSSPVAHIAHQHHERLDGSGYPQGLIGNDIILEARIVAVADVVEAMTSHRPYRAALGFEIAMEEIRKNQGVLYDVDVVDASLRILSENMLKG